MSTKKITLQCNNRLCYSHDKLSVKVESELLVTHAGGDLRLFRGFSSVIVAAYLPSHRGVRARTIILYR